MVNPTPTAMRASIKPFTSLGRFIAAWLRADSLTADNLCGSGSYSRFTSAVAEAQQQNEWFTDEGIRMALHAIASSMLQEAALLRWLTAYGSRLPVQAPKTVGVIAAGNLPLVSFHDTLCVTLSGSKLLLKPSSKDSVLVAETVRLLSQLDATLGGRLTLTSRIEPEAIDGLIATGSSNTARYVDYGYQSVPRLLRMSRSSVAVLTGGETNNELERLATDTFAYFGMGCRSVSKLYVPQGYSFERLVKAAQGWKGRVGAHPKYASCYRYAKALYSTLDEPFIDGGFFVLKESGAYSSPLAVVHFELYNELSAVKAQLLMNAHQLQCVVSGSPAVSKIGFGQAQQPALNDYADGVDTMDWLTKLR